MKRDVDLIRHLLFDIERQGPDCSCDSLRNGTPHEADERTRYHIRLLVDAGFVKEMERTAAGLSCVRLTNAGHEFIELVRGDTRWREAKWVCQEHTGGLSLTVLRAVLTKWAVESIARGERHRRWRRSFRPAYYRDYYHGEPNYRVDSYRHEREVAFDEEPIRLIRPRPDYRERFEHPERWEQETFGGLDEYSPEGPLGVSLPVHMI